MTAKDIRSSSDSATSVLRTDTRWPQCTCSDSMTRWRKWVRQETTPSGKPSKNGIKDNSSTHCCRRFSKQDSKTLGLAWPLELLGMQLKPSEVRLRACLVHPKQLV